MMRSMDSNTLGCPSDQTVSLTITNPACQTYMDATRADPSSSIRRANKTKNDKYFMPMALECNGALSKEFVDVLNKLCEKRAKCTGSDKSVVMQYWYKRISCTISCAHCTKVTAELSPRESWRLLMQLMQMHADDGRDACYDAMIDHEYGNNDTVTIHT
jgi:hypothetical protein